MMDEVHKHWNPDKETIKQGIFISFPNIISMD
jgi:hypothetical protein